MKHTKTDLGELEHEVMRLVWAHGPLTAEAVRERIGRELKEATIRTVLRRLEEKGYVTHTVDNRTFVYSAVESRERVAARAVKRIVDWFCDGSVDDVLVGMVDTEMLGKSQLDKLVKRIEQAKAAKKTPARNKKGEK
ncbi:MAG TPA: BlaI/MecI/CopY family transcriptional regulator [Povalibacter sp.]|nr:BlaI/MecI/CopY family transcriptional regulator [Povalibacter sp.]